MENININTLRFLSVLNGLAEKSKSGILPSMPTMAPRRASSTTPASSSRSAETHPSRCTLS